MDKRPLGIKPTRVWRVQRGEMCFNRVPDQVLKIESGRDRVGKCICAVRGPLMWRREST